MILRLEIILSVTAYKRKDITLYEKILNLRKMTLLTMIFVIEFSLVIDSY